MASKSHRDEALEEYIAKYNVADSRAAGSSLKFCLIAAGEADLYPRVGRTMEWDTAAGHAILSGAGGFVVRYDNHQAISLWQTIFSKTHFLLPATPGCKFTKGLIMKVLIVVPARFESSRFPGKPLVELTGADGKTKSLVQRSWEAAKSVRNVDVVVATDDIKNQNKLLKDLAQQL